MTITESELEIIEALDFDPENECESRFNCGNKAEWAARFKCCGEVQVVCSPCREKDLEWGKMAIRRNRVVMHGACGAVADTLDDMVEWSRIS